MMSDQFPEKPKKIKVKHHDDHITIIRKWFDKYSFLVIALFTLT